MMQFVLAMATAGAASAAHVDPAPLDPAVVGKIAAFMSPPVADRLPEAVSGEMDEAVRILGPVAGGTQPDRWPAHRMQLEGKLAEFAVLRAEIGRRMTRQGAEPRPAVPARGGFPHDPAAGFLGRFDRMIEAMRAVLAANTHAERVRLAKSAMASIDALSGRNQRLKDMERMDSSPTFRQDKPTDARPGELRDAPEPRYAAYRNRAPGNEVYAFLGNTLLAAVADPMPAEASKCDYNADDLAENEDIRITPEIRELAGRLGHSPVRLLHYVVNEIAYEPYFGSLKGAEGTLVSMAGGAIDQASLLIALLRASNIPARYVQGTAQFVNDERLLAWTGAKTYGAAANILSMGKIPTSIPAPGKVEFTHVWVEACVPYGHYRGTGAGLTGHRWIPMDPSFKEKAYQSGIAVNVEFDYADFMRRRTDGPDSLPHERYLRQVEAHVKSLPPDYANHTLADVPYAGQRIRRSLDILPASLPYNVKDFKAWGTGYTAETATLPDAYRHKTEISGTGFTSALNLSMPASVLKRVTLSYKPASSGDAANYAAYVAGTFEPLQSGCFWFLNKSGTCNLKPLNVRPEVRLDGASVFEGASSSIWTKTTWKWSCGSAPSSCQWTEPLPYRSFALQARVLRNGVELNKVKFDGKIKPSDYHALQAYAFQASDRLLRERNARLLKSVATMPDPNANLDETLGEFLHLAGLKYMRYMSDAAGRIAAVDGGSGWVGNHIGLTSANLHAQYLPDLPYGVTSPERNFLVDVPGGVFRNVDLVSGAAVWKTFLLSGYAGSAYESYIWQENAHLDAVSTVRGVQYANEQGIESLTLTPDMCLPEQSAIDAQLAKLASNADASLNYSPAQVAEFKKHVCTGQNTVKLPRSLIRYESWTGQVHFMEKQSATSMTASFMIGGGYGGGYSVKKWLNQSYLQNKLAGMDIGWLLGNPNVFLSGTSPSVVPSTISSWVGHGTGGGNILGKDPVNMVTGNMYHVERDIALKGRGLPIVLERSYNSRDAADGPFGYGWTHSFNHYLEFTDAAPDGSAAGDNKTSTVTWVDGTAARKFIAVTGNPGVAIGASFTTPKGFHFTVARNADGTYSIREKNGLTYTFGDTDATPGDIAGTPTQKARLLSIRDRNGNTLTLDYASGKLATVKDGLNRTLTFTYAGARIAQVQDWGGRVFKYEYDANGNLVAFKNPLAAAGAQNPVSYEYYTAADGANLNHAMKRYILPRGNSMTFEYYANGKVFKHYNTLGETATFSYNDFRRETAYVDERGLERRFFFDENGNPIQVQEEQGGYREYTYDPDSPDKRLSKRDPMGLVTQYAYDSQGNVIRITQPDGNSVEYHDFNAYAQPQRIKDARGNWTLLKYDAQGNLTDEVRLKAGYTPTAGATPPSSQILAWSMRSHDAYGNLAGQKRLKDFTGALLGNFASGLGPTYTYNYTDPQNGTQGLNPVSITRVGDLDGDGADDAPETATLAYDPLGRQTQGMDGDWHTVHKVYDSVDRVIRASDAAGYWQDYGYDANGNLIEEKRVVNGELLDRTTWDYDFSDRAERELNRAGAMTAAQYDPLGNLIRATDADGYVAHIAYDAMNRPVAVYDKAGHATVSRYDLNGRKRTVVDPNGHAHHWDYHGPEQNGQLKESTDPLGRKTRYDHDPHGNVIRITDALGRDSLIDYDELDRPIRQVGPAYADPTHGLIRPVTTYTYNLLGHLTEIAAGRTDASGTHPATDIVTPQARYDHDDFGRKLKATDPLGKATRYVWDRHNNLIERTNARSQKLTQTWDPGHRLKTRTAYWTNGTADRSHHWTYTPLGQVAREETRWAGGGLLVAYDYRYDAAHRLVTVKDSRGNKTLNYHWSPGGLLDTTQDSEGSRTDYLYDPVGRLTGIWAANDDYIAYIHDAGGRLLEKWYPNGHNSQYAWNPDGSLAQVINRVDYHDHATLSQHAYSYTPLGQRASLLEKVGPLAQPPQDSSYAYDPWNNRTRHSQHSQTRYAQYDAAQQLIAERSGSPSGPLVAAYLYDAGGNLRKRCEGGTVTRSGGDCTGALVTQLTWNPYDELIKVNKTGQPTEEYRYDAAGRRIIKLVNGQATHYLYDGEDIHAQYQGWSQAQARYTHGPGTDEPLIRVSANQTRYYHRDGLGSVVASTDGTGTIMGLRQYDAWGNVINQTGSVEHYGYTGREPDGTGLIYYRARYYDPQTGRFISRDPAGMPDGVNRYVYVGNDPVNFTDPSGEIAVNGAGAAIGGVYGGVSGGISGWIVGWNSGGSRGSIMTRAKNALIGLGAGAVSGALAGAGAGFLLRPELAASAPMIVSTGVVGGLFSNMGTTTAQQIKSGRHVDPLAKLTWQESGKILTSAVGGTAAVAGVRLATGLASSTTALVAGRMVPMPGNLATAVVGGVGAGYGESSVAHSGAPQTALRPAASIPTSGSQNLGSFSFAELSAPGGNPWGTNLTGDYSVAGRSGCFKCQD